MTKLASFSVTATTSAQPGLVFELLRSGATWPTWASIRSFTLARPDANGGEGVGSVRVFAVGPLRTHERLLEISPDHTFRYGIISGIPVREHRAVIELAKTHDGTIITWRAGFRPVVPGTGTLLRALMKEVIRRSANGLAARAAALSEP